jgi:sugar phosphate isomerase/epimerase
MQRREFIRQSALLAAGTSLMPSALNAFSSIGPKTKPKPIGVQLWSCKDEMKDDAAGTLKQIAKIGYDYVEGAGYKDGKMYDMKPTEFKKLLKEHQLKMPSGHAPFKPSFYNKDKNTFTDEWKITVETALATGQKYLICPWMDEGDRKTLDAVKRVAEALNKAGEYCNAQNIKFGYHNHDFEFKKVEDQVIYDVLLKETMPENVTFQMDLAWVTYAKGKPVDWFKRYPGRFELCHVKDLADEGEKDSCIVGDGVIDFAEIIKSKSVAGLKMYIIELEHYKKDPLSDLKACHKNFDKILNP